MNRIFTQCSAILVGALAGAALLFQPSLAQTPSAGTVALVNARIIDGTGRPALERATLVVRNGRIQEVGSAAAVKVPAGAVRVDVAGKTIVPGFINSHGHIDAARDSTIPVRDQLMTQLRMYAQYGITTAYSLGSSAADGAGRRVSI